MSLGSEGKRNAQPNVKNSRSLGEKGVQSKDVQQGVEYISGCSSATHLAISKVQKRSTLLSSSGASTSSSTQMGAGFVKNTANKTASAVSACSPPSLTLP